MKALSVSSLETYPEVRVFVASDLRALGKADEKVKYAQLQFGGRDGAVPSGMG
jgi:hypothetical protein